MKGEDEYNEEELIKRILNGENDLFSILVNKYKDQSFSVAFSIVSDIDEAEDIIQESFIQAYNKLNKFRFKSSFATWLYRIVVNKCLSKLKSFNRTRFSALKSEASMIPSDLDTSKGLKEKERRRIINQVLDTLKPNEALVLRLFYLAEQNMQEISEITKLTVPNIKVILHRARKRFHDNLEKQLGSDKRHLYE